MKLLCVETSPGRFRPFEEVLRGEGHELRFVDDASEALELVRVRHADAVLLPFDPGGEELIGDLRRLIPTLPIIAIGERDTALEAARAAAYGTLGYVPSPGEREPDPQVLEVLVSLVDRAAARLRVEDRRLARRRETQQIQKFYRDVLTSVGQGIVVIDQGGKIRFRNPEAARILGEEDDAGRTLESQSAVPIVQMLVDTLAKKQTQNHTIALEEAEEQVFLDVTTSVLRGPDGEATGAVAIVSDRSIEKRLQEQLLHSERLATLGSLLASIAHEINNTLTAITGCAEMGVDLAEMADASAASIADPQAKEALLNLGVEIRQVFDMVLESGISCQTIANNMLQYSRRSQPSHSQEQDLNLLVKRTLELLGKHLGVEKVDLSLELDASNPRVAIESSKLQQTLVNLIVNAVHALMEVPRERRLLRLRTRADRETREAVLVVDDRGPGIPPKRLKHIWQPFFTTKATGTGLGLHIVRSVVEGQGGSIAVESEPDQGTRFTIRLPLA